MKRLTTLHSPAPYKQGWRWRSAPMLQIPVTWPSTQQRPSLQITNTSNISQSRWLINTFFLNYSFHLFLLLFLFFFFFFLLHVLLYKILSNNFIYVTKMFHTRWKSCVFFIFTTIKREQVYRTRVARKLVARGPTSWNHWTRLANLTRGGKIIPVLDSQDPTNLDSFPARVLVRTTWSRAKTPLWTLDKTYDSVKERKKKAPYSSLAYHSLLPL